MKTHPPSSGAASPPVRGLAFTLAAASALALAGSPTAASALALASPPATASALVLASPPTPAGAQSLAVVDVRVFDGEEVIERATVLVEDGVIAVVGPDATVPDGVETIDGAGRTLLPGFIDGHGHSQGEALRRAVVFGTTTVLDMFTDVGWAAEQRAQQAAGEADDRADLFSSGTLATAPGGHGTQYGIPIPTLTTPEEADEWVAARIAEGSDHIKIVIEDGTVIDLETPTLDLPTVQALVQAARSRGKLAVAHTTTLEAARMALAADVDGFVHIFGDAPPPEDFAPAAAEAGIFVVPTLTVLESLTEGASGAPLADDPDIGPLMTSQERAQVASSYPRRASEGYALQHALDAVSALHAAGVPVLAGTDYPNPGTSAGISMHREFELLSSAGFSPAEALAAATSLPADAFGLDDRGRIAAGKRADLVLVEGNPLEDVTLARRIVGVWKGGVAIDRTKPEEVVGTPAELGPVADFDGGEATADYGAGWMDSTDDIVGGNSTVTVEIGDGGAEGSAHYLTVSGEIGDGFGFPWAGEMFYPGAMPMAPVDLSAATELVFWARGEPGTYRVMMFCQALGPAPTIQTFDVEDEWQQVSLRFDAFPGLDASALLGVLWAGGPGTGPFQFDIDQIEIR